MPRISQIGSYFPGSRFWRYWRLHRIPYDLYREAKAFVHRGRYGWAPCDTWSLDRYLEDLLQGTLRHLAAHGHVHPTDETAWTWSQKLVATADAIAECRRADENVEYKSIEEQMEWERVAYEAMQKKLHELVDVWGKLWD